MTHEMYYPPAKASPEVPRVRVGGLPSAAVPDFIKFGVDVEPRIVEVTGRRRDVARTARR